MSNDASIVKLEKRADMYAAASLSPKTRAAYESDWKAFHAWCEAHDIDGWPASAETVCLYISHLADRGLRKSSISRAMTSISMIHESAGNLSPVKDARVNKVWKGICREIGRPKRQAHALSWAEITRMANTCDLMIHGVRDRAILLIGWAAALRRSEISELNVGDVETSREGVILTIRRSKTDPDGHGKRIGIPRARSDLILSCPVGALIIWMNRLGSDKKPPEREEPLFRSLGMAANATWWMPYRERFARRLSDRAIYEIVKKRAAAAGITATVSGHSLRRGLATEAASRGVPERVLSRHTRHASIAQLREYIDSGCIWTENPLSAIYPPSSSSSSSSD